MTTAKAKAGPRQSKSSGAPPPAGACYREHDILIRHFHRAGLAPTEIAFALNNQGLRVRMWAVTEHFVRKRLERLGLKAHHSRPLLRKERNTDRPARRVREPCGRSLE